MAWNVHSKASLFLWVVLSLLIMFSIAVVDAKPRAMSDVEIKMKRDQCYADIENGLWGWDCQSSIVAKENCALKCLSPRCYELIYESDPLEEGEKDLIRNQEYKYCMHRLSLGESLEGIRGSFS